MNSASRLSEVPWSGGRDSLAFRGGVKLKFNEPWDPKPFHVTEIPHVKGGEEKGGGAQGYARAFNYISSIQSRCFTFHVSASSSLRRTCSSHVNDPSEYPKRRCNVQYCLSVSIGIYVLERRSRFFFFSSKLICWFSENRTERQAAENVGKLYLQQFRRLVFGWPGRFRRVR